MNEQLVVNTIRDSNANNDDTFKNKNNISNDSDLNISEQSRSFDISRDNKSDDSSSSNSLENLLIRIDLDIKVLTTASSIFCLCTIAMSLVFSAIRKSILTFDLRTEETLTLRLNSIMIFIYLIILAIFNCALVFFLVKQKEEMLLKMVYKELRWAFILTQFCFGSLFLIGIVWRPDNWPRLLSASVNMLTTLLLAFYFVDIKMKKNMRIGTFICFFCYLSVLLAFITYVTLFNFNCILVEGLNKLVDEPEDVVEKIDKPAIQIVSNLVQTLLSLVLLTYYKDFFFAISSFYLELSVIVHKDFDISLSITKAIIVFLGLILLSTLMVVLKYGRKAIGFEDVKEITFTTKQDDILGIKEEVQEKQVFENQLSNSSII